MKRLTPATLCHMLVLALLLFGSLNVNSTYAQGPLPPAPARPVPSPEIAEEADYDAEIVTSSEAVTTQDTVEDASEAVESGVEATEESLSAISAEAEPAPSMVDALPALQGDVKLDVSTPDEVRAGETIAYTYAYTNTGTTTATGIKIKTTWTRFRLTNTGGIVQYCEPSSTPGTDPCDVIAASVIGPPVQMTGIGTEYSVGDLAPGASGRFSILLRTRTDIYPQAGKALVRPAGSGELVLSGSTTAISDDTATSLIAGPVLIVTKRAAMSGKLLPTETGEFTITLGNATDRGADVRADAREATGIVLIDTFPLGSEFISATGNPAVDQDKRTLTWRISSLKPNQTLDFGVTFRKLDVNNECRKLSNKTLTATSDEYPFKGAERYVVAGKSASFDVLDPLVIRSVTATPSSAIFGNDATLTFVVENYWGQAINGAQLSYSVQTNANYVPGTATPPPSSVDPNGTIIWTFDMPAGTKTTPTRTTFSVRLQAGYTTEVQRGSVQIIAPSNVPSACIQSKSARVGLKPRLEVTKTTPTDPSTKIGNLYQVERGQLFDYTITVINNGTTGADTVQITDLLPKEAGAGFSYVAGSSFIDGQQRNPNDSLDGQDGFILWSGLVVPPGATLEIRYKLQVEGLRYQNYCNKVSGNNGPEKVTLKASSVCVKINPQIELSKVGNKTTALPGEEVRFTLTLTNRESVMYRVGLFDRLNNYEFVRQESGYDTPQQVTGGLKWPLTDVPPGQSISAVIIVRVPNVCKTANYINEALFHNDEGSLIKIVPAVTARVGVVCGQLDFSKSVERNTYSLGDRILYILRLKNTGTNPESNITVEDLMQQGLTFESMTADSQVKTAPVQSNVNVPGYTQLIWLIPTVAPQTTLEIKYFARAGNIIGTYENKLTMDKGRCSASCADDGSYSVKTVNVEPLITIEPQIVETECATPGEARTYRLSIVNTNVHDYNNIEISVKLPFGLTYARALGETQPPLIEQTPDGGSRLIWSGQRILKGQPQKDYEVELLVGQVFGNLDAIVTTTSPDGIIPRKDGTLDPTVAVCIGDPAIYKDASRRLIRPGEELIYGITLVNPTAEPLTASIEDRLNVAFSFVANVQGPQPSRSDNTLTWNNLQVPAATAAGPGRLILQFKVREIASINDTSYDNTVTVIESSQDLDTTYASVSVLVVKDIITTFLPLVRR